MIEILKADMKKSLKAKTTVEWNEENCSVHEMEIESVEKTNNEGILGLETLGLA